jgi:hypothetical protein
LRRRALPRERSDHRTRPTLNIDGACPDAVTRGANNQPLYYITRLYHTLSRAAALGAQTAVIGQRPKFLASRWHIPAGVIGSNLLVSNPRGKLPPKHLCNFRGELVLLVRFADPR